METDKANQLMRDVNAAIFRHIVECASPIGNDEWIVCIGKPHNNEATHKEFMSAVLRAVLTPPDEHERNGVIRHALEDTTTGPLDESGGT